MTIIAFRLLPALLVAPLLVACGEKTSPSAMAVAAPAKPAIRDGSLMSPGRPQLTGLPAQAAVGAVQPITWNMWWGENGSEWAVYVNGVEIERGTLAMASPKEQQATVELPLAEPGPVEIKVALCNDHGCTESDPVTLTVNAG